MMINSFHKAILYVLLALMILVPTDFIEMAMTGMEHHEVSMSLEMELDSDAEEKDTKEKSKEKNKIRPADLAIEYGWIKGMYKSNKRKFSRTIRPKVLHLEVYTPPPEQV